MINTSKAYKKAIKKNRVFSIHDKYVFADGSEPEISLSDFVAYSINEATSESGKFTVGAAVIKKYTAALNNEADKFSFLRFEGCDISAKVGLLLDDSTTEVLPKGRYRVVGAKSTGLTVSLEAYDSMLFFDRPYSESTLVYPATLSEIVRDACTHCHVAYDISTLTRPDYVVQQRPNDEALTFRDVISYCAQIQCCFAKINNLDQLVFGWYSFAAAETGSLDGGAFDRANQNAYLSGDDADGGGFLDYGGGHAYDAGTAEDTLAYHNISDLSSQNINTDDVCITGVRVVATTDSDDAEESTHGEEGYVLSIEDNPLVQQGRGEDVAGYLAQRLIGKTFRPLSITCRSDPSIEAGDDIVVTDRKQRAYASVVTNTTFSLGVAQQVTCDAETPTENSYAKYGAATKILSSSKAETGRQLSCYDLAAAQLGGLMAHSMGMYETREVDPDTGAEIRYMHDKPLLSDSKTVWKQTIDAFAVSTDGGENWNSGVDASGNVLANVLTAIGINADWINAGTITGVTYKSKTGNLVLRNGNVISTNNDGTLQTTISSGYMYLTDQAETPLAGIALTMSSLLHNRVLTTYGSTSLRSQEAYYNDDGTVTQGNSFFSVDFVGRTMYSDLDTNINTLSVVNFTNASDPRLKDIRGIVEPSTAKNILQKLRPLEFSWKDDLDGELHFGFSADDVKAALGEEYGTVIEDKKGIKSVAYHEIIPLLVAALEHASREIESLKNRIERLEEQYGNTK